MFKALGWGLVAQPRPTTELTEPKCGCNGQPLMTAAWRSQRFFRAPHLARTPKTKARRLLLLV